MNKYKAGPYRNQEKSSISEETLQSLEKQFNAKLSRHHKPKFDRSRKDVRKFNTDPLYAAQEFVVAPGWYYLNLPKSGQRVLRAIVKGCLEYPVCYASYEYFAKVAGCSVRTVAYYVDLFRSDNIIGTMYRHNTTNFYRLATDWRRPSVINSLKKHIPILGAILTSFLLLSRIAPTAAHQQICIQRKKDINKTLILNNATQNPTTISSPSGPKSIATILEGMFTQKNITNFYRDKDRRKDSYKDQVRKKEFHSESATMKHSQLPNETKPSYHETFKMRAFKELVPPAAQFFKSLPLTLAGKIKLSIYKNDAILYAERLIDKRLSPASAFEKLCHDAQEWCFKNGVHLDHATYELLVTAYEIDASDPLVIDKKHTKTEAYIPYTALPRTLPHEDIYISYFKVQEHYKTKGNPLNLPNPYREEFIKEVERCAKETNFSPTELKEGLYKIYLAQKANPL